MTGAVTRVWDLPTRLFHWALVLLVTFSIVSAKIGGNWIDWHMRSGIIILSLLVLMVIGLTPFVALSVPRTLAPDIERFTPDDWRARTPITALIRGLGQFGGLNNTAGLNVNWDLRDVILSIGYDHVNQLYSSSTYEYLNHASDFGFVRASFQVHPSATEPREAT